jgi:hypothetical protein
MFYARYIVLQVGNKEVPFILSDADVHGWERPRGNTMPYRQKVLGAGFVTWLEGDPTSVVCFGSGKMSVDALRGTTRMVDSRGVVDAALVQELLAQPLNYVILRLGSKDLPIFGAQSLDHEGMVLRYQVYPSRHAVSAGEVDFGHATAQPVRCYGKGAFIPRPGFACSSRGEKDVAFLKAHLVKHVENPEPSRAYRLF